MMRELFDTRERPLFGQAIRSRSGALPLDDVARRPRAGASPTEGLDPGEALGELAVFAAGHPQRMMLLGYLLAERSPPAAPPTPELAALVLDAALAITAPAHQALWQAARRQRERRAGRRRRRHRADVAARWRPSTGWRARRCDEAADRLADQGHLARTRRGTRWWTRCWPNGSAGANAHRKAKRRP